MITPHSKMIIGLSDLNEEGRHWPGVGGEHYRYCTDILLSLIQEGPTDLNRRKHRKEERVQYQSRRDLNSL